MERASERASVDGQVPRTRSLRTASGPGGSSAKEYLPRRLGHLARASGTAPRRRRTRRSRWARRHRSQRPARRPSRTRRRARPPGSTPSVTPVSTSIVKRRRQASNGRVTFGSSSLAPSSWIFVAAWIPDTVRATSAASTSSRRPSGDQLRRSTEPPMRPTGRASPGPGPRRYTDMRPACSRSEAKASLPSADHVGSESVPCSRRSPGGRFRRSRPSRYGSPAACPSPRRPRSPRTRRALRPQKRPGHRASEAPGSRPPRVVSVPSVQLPSDAAYYRDGDRAL